ncbi:GekBS024P [Symbiodinium natans]|uniref:GekBS024P protein n=1 Tax=Symbiodinium natans TaxID=878477 RepID=A0A812SDW3_9DINO|nr:GekBS024P [Symbiodinium natans]
MMCDLANVPDVSANLWHGLDDSKAIAGYLAEPMKVPLPQGEGKKQSEFGQVFIPMPQCPDTGRVLRFQDPIDEARYSDLFDAAPESPGSVVTRGGSRVYFPPGLDPPVNTPSHGSTLHAEGNCKPCAWFWKPGSCQNGKDCMHCHLCPKDELKMRKKAKSAFMRLGLTTPKPDAEETAAVQLALSSFCMSPKAKEKGDFCETSEQGSTVATASEREYSDASASPRQPLAGEALTEMPVTKLASQGSNFHGNGNCRPCAWFWKPTGCLNGEECRHCHMCPPGEVKNRKKNKLAMLRLGLATPTAAATNAKALAWQLHDVLLRAAPACSRTPSPWTRQPRDRSSIAKRCQAWSSHVKDAAASIRLSSWAIGIAPAPMTDCLQPQEPQWRSPDLVFSAELHARCLAEGWCTSCHGTACLHRPSCSIHLPQWGTRACSFLWLDWRYSRATCAPRDVSRPRPF